MGRQRDRERDRWIDRLNSRSDGEVDRQTYS